LRKAHIDFGVGCAWKAHATPTERAGPLLGLVGVKAINLVIQCRFKQKFSGPLRQKAVVSILRGGRYAGHRPMRTITLAKVLEFEVPSEVESFAKK
jgi:hypothetical protein